MPNEFDLGVTGARELTSVLILGFTVVWNDILRWDTTGGVTGAKELTVRSSLPGVAGPAHRLTFKGWSASKLIECRRFVG